MLMLLYIVLTIVNLAGLAFIFKAIYLLGRQNKLLEQNMVDSMIRIDQLEYKTDTRFLPAHPKEIKPKVKRKTNKVKEIEAPSKYLNVVSLFHEDIAKFHEDVNNFKKDAEKLRKDANMIRTPVQRTCSDPRPKANSPRKRKTK